jgi:hypothetical protein
VPVAEANAGIAAIRIDHFYAAPRAKRTRSGAARRLPAEAVPRPDHDERQPEHPEPRCPSERKGQVQLCDWASSQDLRGRLLATKARCLMLALERRLSRFRLLTFTYSDCRRSTDLEVFKWHVHGLSPQTRNSNALSAGEHLRVLLLSAPIDDKRTESLVLRAERARRDERSVEQQLPHSEQA